jgi:PAS domain S-box-containing protein
MNYQFSGSFFLQSLPCLFAFIIINILWKRRHVEGVFYLILLEFVASVWALTDALEHAANSLQLKIFWSQMGNFGSTTTAVFFLLFTFTFTQQHKFTNWKSILILFTIPVITIILAFTNSNHHLIWKSVDFFPQTNDSVYHYGKWFWIFVYYEFACVALSIIMLLLSTLRFYKIYKTQVFFLIVASILPLTSSILYVFKLTPLKADMTPASLIFSGIFVAVGIYKQGMIDIIPIARKQIVDSLGDGIIVIDLADRIVDVNAAIRAITGSNHEKLIGKPFGVIKEKILQDCTDDSEPGRYTFETVIKVDHDERFFEVTCNKVTDIRQKLIGRIFILHDITTRKMALDYAVESNNRLRKEISEKEKLIVDLDAYARSVAHDLKNPISGLLGLSEVLKEYLANKKYEEILELLDLAHEQSLKMYIIVDELLLLSRIRKEDINLEVLDMASVINEALKRLKGQFAAENITIELPHSWPKVLGHPQWIEEVWFNFISNAIKYGGDPPVIKTGYEKINDSYRFWIQDNGNGLPSEAFLKIFKDFERLGRMNVEGHGLGLSIVKRIIEKLGGEVSGTSENVPGKGCIFSFTLKCSRAEELDGFDSSGINQVSVNADIYNPN